jgi:hypothetical protein
VFDLCHDALDAVSRGLKRASLSEDTIYRLGSRFRYVRSNWTAHRTVHACIHAELRIILHLSSRPQIPDFPGPSCNQLKRSCFCCTMWIDEYNTFFNTNWMTGGSEGKPHADWAFPGSAASYAIGAKDSDGLSSVDRVVQGRVSRRVTNIMILLFPDKGGNLRI